MALVRIPPPFTIKNCVICSVIKKAIIDGSYGDVKKVKKEKQEKNRRKKPST